MAKLPSIRANLLTEQGQITLFLLCSLLAATAVLAIDRLNHPMLLILALPPIAVLAGRAILDMQRVRARIFIMLCALLFALLTVLIITMATPWGQNFLPWNLSLWTIAPLAGTALFCTVFLVRAAQVSAGKTLLLGFAICWLLMAQVFLFTGMPVALVNLKTEQFLNNQLPGNAEKPLSTAQNATPNLKEHIELKGFLLPIFNATIPLMPSMPALPNLNATVPGVEQNTALPAPLGGEKNSESASGQNATQEMPLGVLAPVDQNATPTQTGDDSSQLALSQNATSEAFAAETEQAPGNAIPPLGIMLAPEETVPATSNSSPVSSSASTPSSSPASPVGPSNGIVQQPQNAAQPTPLLVPPVTPPIVEEETMLTTYTPKQINKLNLVYGSIAAPPEFVISVRYHSLKRIEENW